ncbi:hypothetical protein JMJ77_0012752 [Colletotrichum scovillei]|uniref:Uncharacterized protein n=1 Tax=Colletotrichum scovillei TaxID=1209932 RepID=A0A9P7R4D1_9PEZI|nr:hypothetical protein JMJ77_0012752 [Colletotrichum scovillei]KAG7069033.1 hypothetical protein JMJ76_0002711 [Colletotrichum scovillei]KAG7072989.1 hypothetical protein JMJ78_0013972 [Colletotrichum scovillei]
MVSALPYSSQREPTQQEDIPEETDWSESEPDVTRRSYRQHQRHTEPVGNFEDLSSQFAWDGTYADPDSLSPHHEARFATGQTVPYRRGHLEGFADPSRHRGPPPPGPDEPQGFSQQPQGPAMNYHGVPPPPPPPHPGVYPMHAPPMPHYTPAPHTAGWKNSMGGPRPMRPPPSTYPPPIEPYGPYYVPHQGPVHPHPYAATPRSHAYNTGPRPQTALPRQRKNHYPQYPAPQEPVEGYYEEASAPKSKKHPKPRQEKPPKRSSRDDEMEEMKRGLEDLAFRQQQVHDVWKAQERRERKKASEAALKASLVKEVTKTVRKEFQNGANAQLRDIDMRSESSRRMLRSDIGSRGFSAPVPSVYDDQDTGSIIQATVMETLRAVRGQSLSDLGGFQAPHRPSHRRAASELPYSGGGHPPLPGDSDPTATNNPFMPNRTIYGQPPYQGPDPQQRQAQRSEAYWTGTVRKPRARSGSHSGPQLQRDTNMPLHGSLSPGDSGYASPEPLRSERPHGQSRARKVSFRDSDGASRPRHEHVRDEQAVDWSEDEVEVLGHPQRQRRTYTTGAPGRPNFTIEVMGPPPTAPEVGHF